MITIMATIMIMIMVTMRTDRHPLRLAGVGLVLLSGCGYRQSELPPIEAVVSLPMATEAAVNDHDADDARATTPTRLQLDEALAWARAHHPGLAAAEADRRRASGEQAQAGRWRNPRLMVENMGAISTRDDRDPDDSETTVVVQQPFELGGKRQARVDRAAAGLAIEEADLLDTRRVIDRDVRQAFYQVLLLEGLAQLDQERVVLVEELQEIVARAVDAGTVPAIDGDRVILSLTEARLALAQTRHHVISGRQQLAASMGRERVDFGELTGSLSLPADPEQLAVDEGLRRHPSLTRLAAERRAQAARLGQAQADAVPDVTLGLGGKYFGHTDDTALVLQLGLPLPVADRRQGEQDAARAAIAAVEARYRAQFIRLQDRSSRVLHDLRAAREQAQLIADQAVPAAVRSREASLVAYEAGEQDYGAVIAAQQAEILQRRELLQRQWRYWDAHAELLALIGE